MRGQASRQVGRDQQPSLLEEKAAWGFNKKEPKEERKDPLLN